jgi:ubiquinone/menaquinone biosynthesis C-methylase UbiE
MEHNDCLTPYRPAMKKLYERHLLPHLIEYACGMGEIMKTRSKLIPQAEGRVLEVGIGTGLNLAFYDARRVHSVTGVDPAPEMHGRARRRAAALSFPVETIALELGEIQAKAASFDTIVCTFTLCTIPDVAAAFSEMRRVLKPGGRFLFSEHGRAPDAHIAGWQDRLTPWWKPFAGGCHLNRDIPQIIRAGGFTIESLDAGYLKGPKPMTYVYRGWAR